MHSSYLWWYCDRLMEMNWAIVILKLRSILLLPLAHLALSVSAGLLRSRQVLLLLLESLRYAR